MGSCTMMLGLLLQVFLLFISASLSSPQPQGGPPIKPPGHGGPPIKPPGHGGPPIKPPGHGGPPIKPPTGTLTPTELKQWLDNPTNMNMLWSMAKRTVNSLPPPRNLEELEYFLTSIGQIARTKLTLLKGLTEGDPPRPIDKGFLMGLLHANSVARIQQLFPKIKGPS